MTKMGKDLAVSKGAMCICESSTRQCDKCYGRDPMYYEKEKQRRKESQLSSFRDGLFQWYEVDAGVTWLGVRPSSAIHWLFYLRQVL